MAGGGSTNKLFWNRVGHVEVEQPDGSFTSYTGLDFKFDVMISGCTYSRFSVGICGLSRDSLNSLITWPQPESYRNPRHVKVYAGYEDGGESLIAQGGIFSAIPTPPPNVWLNIEACKFLENRRPIEGEPPINGSFIEIFTRVGHICGMDTQTERGVWSVLPKDKDTYDFEFTGSVELLPQKLADAFNLNIYEKDGRLIADVKRKEYSSPSNAITLDRESGLLGVGTIEYNKASVTTRLNPAYELFTWVDLKSERIPQADDKYWVTNVRHTGHLRGDEWRTTLTMLKHRIRTGS